MNNRIMAIMIQNAQTALVSTANAVPEDKLDWRPLENGRPVRDLLAETAQIAGIGAQVAQTRGEIKISYELFQQMKEERTDWSREHSLQLLEENTAKLLAELENMSNEELNQDVTMPIRGGVTMPLANWILQTHRTFVSRTAQINYIQTLYGDFEFH